MARRPRVLGCVRCDKAAARLAAISSCTSRPQRKADLRDEAIERFAVSKSAFDFAWIWAIEETGNRHWYEPLPQCRPVLYRFHGLQSLEVTRPADDHSSPPDHSVEQTGSGSRSEGDYRLEKKLSTFFPNAMWSMKRCQ
jgi:hypothetical protein